MRGIIKLYSEYSACIEHEDYGTVSQRKEIFNSWERKHKEKFYSMFIHIVPGFNVRQVRKKDGMNHGAVDVLT